jgi:hypothetical protein
MRAHARLVPCLALVATLLSLLAGPPARAQAAHPPVVINEVYYDAPGTDSGYEFVELLNPTAAAVALTGYRLEAGDGAGPGRWRLVWSGAAADVVPPGARFVIGEATVFPAPDRVQTLALENGPDALRLVAPDGSADVVGYGALTYAEYFAGRPAPDAPAGSSLARLPDGADTGDNATDFAVVSPPTPGAPNQPERDLAVRHAETSERVEPGEPVRAHAVLVNRGRVGLAAHEIAVLLWAAPRPPDTGTTYGQGDAGLAPDSLVARLDGPADLDPGDSTAVDLAFTALLPGAWDVTLAVSVLDDGVAANDRVTAPVQVGPGALLVNEVEAAPHDGPEWVEVVNASGGALAPFDWTLEDATGRRAVVAPAPADGSLGLVAPDSLAVLTSDPQALLALCPELLPDRVFGCVPWPALNNTGADGAPADRVVVRAPDGRVSDAVDLPDADPAGASYERRALTSPSASPATWGASAVEGGTPGRANSIGADALPGGVGLSAAAEGAWPLRNRPALLTYRTAFERARVTLAVYDLRGRPVRRLLDDALAPGAAGVAWAGDDAAGKPVPPGLYVAGLTASDADGVAPPVRARACVVVR